MTLLGGNPDEIDHNHTRKALPHFLDYDGWDVEDPPPVDTERVRDYPQHITVLTGFNGPWFARQRFGEWAGVIVSFTGWGTPALTERDASSEIYRIFADEGYKVHFNDASPRDSELSRMGDNELIAQLFGEAERRATPLPDDYAERQAERIHV